MLTSIKNLSWMLLTLLLLTSKTLSYQFLFLEPADEDLEYFYSDTKYLVIYVFLWNFLIEISIIIVMHFKQTPDYVANHSFINFCIIIGQFVNNCLMVKTYGYRQPFFILEGVLTCMEGLQIFLGNSLNRKLQSEDLVKKIFILRALHRNNGRLMYILRKYQLISYAVFYFKSINIALSGIAIVPILIVTVLTHISAYIILRKNIFSVQRVEKSYLIQTSNDKKEEYIELLKNIENGELEDDLNENVLDEENIMGVSLIKKSIKWVMIENEIYDITDLRHPKGNYILKGIQGRDVTREIHGFKSFRFESKNKKFSKTLKHKHVPRTFDHLMNRCIGPISICPLICKADSSSSVKEDSAITLQLSEVINNSENNQVLLSEIDWQSDSLYALNDKCAIIYINKIEKDYLVNLSIYWLYTFGKYFTITFENGKKDFLYALLSFTPTYVNKKFEWYRKLNAELTAEIKLPASALHKDLKDLHKVMLQGLDRNQRQCLETTNEIRSCHLPLYWQARINSKKIKKSKFKMQGPIGMGLGFDANCSSKVLMIVKDEGILPLLDFFEFISQKALIELTGVSHPIFTHEYLYAYSNKPEFSIYWEISEDYWPIAESLALGVFHTINIAYKRDSTKKINKIVKLITISSILSVNQNNIILSVANEKRNFSDIIDLNKGEFDQYIVSGNDKFVNYILETSTVSQSKISVL